MTPELKVQRCPDCGGWHSMACPRISEIEFADSAEEGRRVKVKYHGPGWERYYQSQVLYLEDFDDEEVTSES